MSLSFTGPKGWIEQRWIVYATLRDNVQHHLENGTPSEAFSALHAIAEALGGKRVSVSARKLHDELASAKQKVVALPIDKMAVSLRTRSVISLVWPPPDHRETTLLSEWGGTIPLIGARAKTLHEVFGHLIEGLMRITEDAGEGDVVEVSDL